MLVTQLDNILVMNDFFPALDTRGITHMFKIKREWILPIITAFLGGGLVLIVAAVAKLPYNIARDDLTLMSIQTGISEIDNKMVGIKKKIVGIEHKQEKIRGDVSIKISEQISEQTTTLSGEMHKTENRLRDKIDGIETKLRTEFNEEINYLSERVNKIIASNSIRSQLDIPTKALAELVGEGKGKSISNETFISWSSEVHLKDKGKEYIGFRKQMAKKGLNDIVYTEAGNNKALTAFMGAKEIKEISKATGEKSKIPISYHPTGNTPIYESGYKWNKPLEFFKLPGVNASNIIRVPLTKKKTPSN